MPIQTSTFISKYEARVQEGFGQGRMADYKPWLDVRSTHSCATRTTLWCARLGRAMHFLSQGERLAYLQFEWRKDVLDIREQFPLDPNVTLAICGNLKVLHPGHGQGGCVMSSDFLVTYRTPTGTVERAFQIKRSRADLENRRVATKLLVESRYWKLKKIEWTLLFSEEFPKMKCRNLDRLSGFRNEVIQPGDVPELMAKFRIWRSLYPDCCASTLPQNEVVMLPSGRRMSAMTAVILLAAHQFVRFPIDDVRVDDCVLADFVPGDDHASL